jgi:hypothetical protein
VASLTYGHVKETVRTWHPQCGAVSRAATRARENKSVRREMVKFNFRGTGKWKAIYLLVISCVKNVKNLL